ncbi:MAG TPA: T9SS type A sorting domain-containing protein, partial [Candidatus Binatia bacterium]|nr:T9SS type A sorting domain-containing protein [Candidatus Binatia bacterium]
VAIGAEGTVRLEDRGVSAGQRYGYRVGTTFQGADHLYGEVEVETPLFSLRVAPAAGNPVRQNLSLSMTLPSTEPARVELFDMRGRRLDSVNVLGQGRHIVTLGVSRPPASGIYIVRLSQGGRTASSKVAFLR